MKWIYLFLVLIVFMAMFIFGFPLPYYLNNYRLNSFARQLDVIPVPHQTERIGTVTKNFDNLGTCSKHGDYYAEFIIVSKLPLQQLKRFYKQFHVNVPEIKSPLFSFFTGLGTHGPIDIEIKKDELTNNRYRVYAFDPDYWHNDFRCW